MARTDLKADQVVSSLTQIDAGVSVVLKRNAKEETAKADWLIGADGGGSPHEIIHVCSMADHTFAFVEPKHEKLQRNVLDSLSNNSPQQP